MQIALLLGSFNPVHRGHVAVARWALASGKFDQVMVVPTPQNPMKTSDELAPWQDRLSMLHLAFDCVQGVQISTVEMDLPTPHYTINTIEHLEKLHPADTFSILCGSDILKQLPHWHRSDELQEMVDFVAYPRLDESSELPQYAENSSDIRSGKLLTGLDASVLAYIELHGLYFASPISQARRAWAAADLSQVINIAVNNPQSDELEKMAQMAREILDFRCTDLYNP